MGLDMYFYLEDKETKEITEFAYYRKFNALQGYFEKEHDIENGGKVLMTEEIINSLFDKLNEICYSPEKADSLLPTYSGPFFGNYEYDRMYHNYVHEASRDLYHMKFVDRNRWQIYFCSDW